MKPKILAFAGSTRSESLNKKLVLCATKFACDAEITLIDLRNYPLPLYDGDLEINEGLPENAHKLTALFLSHHGLMIASASKTQSHRL